jgi:protein subunit release factor B
VEAMDWAEMLERMYLRWAAARGYRVATTSRTPGERQGLDWRSAMKRYLATHASAVASPPWRTSLPWRASPYA